MKVALLSRHEGMDYYFRDVLEDHEVKRFQCDKEKPDDSFDVYVVGLPTSDIAEVIKFGKPIISYPCLWDYRNIGEAPGYKAMKEALDKGLLRVVLNSHAWMPSFQETFPGVQFNYIPYAFKNLRFNWTGDEEKVIVVNRRPEDRLKPFTDLSLAKVLEGMDYEVHTWTPRDEVLKRMSKCRAILYYSNSPWTLVFCEAMSMGIPIVTFDGIASSAYANVSGKVDVVRDGLQRLLRDRDFAYQCSIRNTKMAERTMDFDEAKMGWNSLIKTL